VTDLFVSSTARAKQSVVIVVVVEYHGCVEATTKYQRGKGDEVSNIWKRKEPKNVTSKSRGWKLQVASCKLQDG